MVLLFLSQNAHLSGVALWREKGAHGNPAVTTSGCRAGLRRTCEQLVLLCQIHIGEVLS